MIRYERFGVFMMRQLMTLRVMLVRTSERRVGS